MKQSELLAESLRATSLHSVNSARSGKKESSMTNEDRDSKDCQARQVLGRWACAKPL